MTASAAAVWLNTVFASFDESVMLLVHRLYDLNSDFFTPIMNFISLLGKGGIAMILMGLILLCVKKTRRFGTAVLLGIAIGFLITNCCLKIFIARPRPYVDQNSVFYKVWLLMGQHTESDKSFPSGHMTVAMSAMTAIFWVGDKRISWTAFLFAILMGISRIYLVVHFASDVLGGLVVGFVAGSLGALIASKLPDKWYKSDFLKKRSA